MPDACVRQTTRMSDARIQSRSIFQLSLSTRYVYHEELATIAMPQALASHPRLACVRKASRPILHCTAHALRTPRFSINCPDIQQDHKIHSWYDRATTSEHTASYSTDHRSHHYNHEVTARVDNRCKVR